MIGLVAFDDLDARAGIKTMAASHHHLVLDDQDVELDLSAEHREELRAFLKRFLEATGQTSPGKPNAYGPGGLFAERKDFLTAFRKWADSQDPAVVYRSPAGNGYYYRPADLRRFEAELREKLDSGLGRD